MGGPAPLTPPRPDPDPAAPLATPDPATTVADHDTQPAVPTAPDPTGPATVWQRVGWYSLAAVVATAITAAGLRLDAADLRAPFTYDEDALLILPFVKATVERGSHWRNERLGAPGLSELHDFPVIDHLHFAILWAMGRVVTDVALLFNLYYLLTYPLTAVVAAAVFRHFRFTFAAAVAGGLVFTFLPYHHMRGESHYFLAAYWVVPVSLMAALWVCRGELPFFARDPAGRWRVSVLNRRSVAAVAIGAATASAGAYYAYFACSLFLAAGLYGWVQARTWRAFAAACLLIGVVVAGGVANHLPSVFYQVANGQNSWPHARLPEEAEHYGLKIAQLLLPVNDHNFPPLAKIKSAYNSDFRPLQNENGTSSLGLIGAAGFLGLMAVFFLPVKRRWPYGPLAALVAFGVLVGTVGGFGAVFNHLVFPQVRCYNRISIYIAFLCLFASFHAVDRLCLKAAADWRWVRYPAFTILVIVGVWDQTPFTWFRPGVVEANARAAERYREDARFFGEIEATLPPGAAVFELPFVAYPESPAVQKLQAYDHARGYIHTAGLAWSFGAMKGREADAWQRDVSAKGVQPMLQALVLRGFQGLLVDKRGYTPRAGQAMVDDVRAALGQSAAVVAHPDGKQVFFDLRPYRDWVRGQSPDWFDAEAKRDAEQLVMLWLHGFHSFEPPGQEWRHRWGSRTAKAVLVNPADRTRTVKLKFAIRSDAEGEFEMALDGRGLLADTFPISPRSEPREYTVTVPPGRHTVTFRCRPPGNYYPSETRDLCFFVKDFTMTEVVP